MSTREILIAILIVSLGVTGTAWFLANFEQVTEKVMVGFRGEARRNPWLAAERLLDRMNLPASEMREFDALRNLEPNSMLVLPQGRLTISAPVREHIVSWVRNGGFLVIEAENPSIADPFIDEFGVERVEAVYDDATGDFAQDDEEIVYDAQDADYDDENPLDLTLVQLPGSAQTSLVWMAARFSLRSERAWFWAGTEYASNMLLLREGDGMVAVVSDLDFATNGEIGELNHAQFVVELARFAQATGGVIFFNNPGQPSLMKWLKANAWAPLSAAALALLLWLWQVVPRFGPVAPDPERARRRLLDHLRASGRFLWARGQAGHLLDVSREACLRKISRALPDFETATASTQASQLERMFGISAEQVQQILVTQKPGKMLHFTHTIHLYQTIHARLAMKQTQSNGKKT